HRGRESRDAPCDVVRINGEDHRDEILVVEFWDRAGEDLVSIGHACLAEGSDTRFMLPWIAVSPHQQLLLVAIRRSDLRFRSADFADRPRAVPVHRGLPDALEERPLVPL